MIFWLEHDKLSRLYNDGRLVQATAADARAMLVALPPPLPMQQQQLGPALPAHPPLPGLLLGSQGLAQQAQQAQQQLLGVPPMAAQLRGAPLPVLGQLPGSHGLALAMQNQVLQAQQAQQLQWMMQWPAAATAAAAAGPAVPRPAAAAASPGRGPSSTVISGLQGAQEASEDALGLVGERVDVLERRIRCEGS